MISSLMFCAALLFGHAQAQMCDYLTHTSADSHYVTRPQVVAHQHHQTTKVMFSYEKRLNEVNLLVRLEVHQNHVPPNFRFSGASALGLMNEKGETLTLTVHPDTRPYVYHGKRLNGQPNIRVFELKFVVTPQHVEKMGAFSNSLLTNMHFVGKAHDWSLAVRKPDKFERVLYDHLQCVWQSPLLTHQD